MNISFKNKTIVVSGGTKGVGKDVVLKASKLGANVVFGGRDVDAALSIINRTSENSGKVTFIKADVTSEDECKNLFTKAFEEHSRIDGFLNYTGVTDAAPLLELNSTHIDKIFSINVQAAILCSKFAVNNMIKTNGGSIVHIGSPHAWIGDYDRVAYACSKASILTLSDHIAKHYAKYNIRSNVVTMGWTPTEGELSLRESQGISEEELKTKAAEVLPTGKMTEVEDITYSILFLLSDNSKMVSGSNFRVTGGWFL